MRPFLSLLLAGSLLLPGIAAADDGKLVVWRLEAKAGVTPDEIDSISGLMAAEVERLSGRGVISEADVQTMLKGETVRQQCGGEDSSCMAEIGAALGVPEVVAGDLGRVGDYWALNLRRINVQRAEVIKRASRTVKGDINSLVEALPVAVAGLFDGSAAPPVVTPPPEPNPAPEQPPEPAGPPGSRTHDGFFLRLSTGVGYAFSKESYQGNDLTIRGVALGSSFGIGYMVIENLAVNADIFGLVQPEPTVKVNGAGGAADDTTVTSGAFGVGLTYYFMPANVYLASSVGVGFFQIKSNGVSIESDPGLGVNLMVGKEWWVSDNWGLGIAAQGVLTWVKEKNIDAHITTYGTCLLFSATYN